MASEQKSEPKSTLVIPSWVEASLFEPVFKEIAPDYKQTKAFKVLPALAAGENYATVMLRLEADIEMKGEYESKLITKWARQASNFVMDFF